MSQTVGTCSMFGGARTQGFPCKLFVLLDMASNDEFLEKYREFQDLATKCPDCIDMEFSMPVLSFIPKSLSGEEVWSKVGSLRSFLTDLAIFTPLSSDAVECVHGLYQAKLHRFRGRKPSDSKAQELGLWAVITGSYERFRSRVWDEIGDKGAMHRMCRYGRKGSNQYTDRQERPTGPETPHAESSVWKMGHMDKVCTLESLAKKNRRKVCGHLSRICFFFSVLRCSRHLIWLDFGFQVLVPNYLLLQCTH